MCMFHLRICIHPRRLYLLFFVCCPAETTYQPLQAEPEGTCGRTNSSCSAHCSTPYSGQDVAVYTAGSLPPRGATMGPKGATPRTRSPDPSLSTADPRLGGEPTQPEDFSSCTLSQEHSFEKPQRASQRLCRRPARPALRAFYTPMQNPKRRPVMHLASPSTPKECTGPLPLP